MDLLFKSSINIFYKSIFPYSRKIALLDSDDNYRSEGSMEKLTFIVTESSDNSFYQQPMMNLISTEKISSAVFIYSSIISCFTPKRLFFLMVMATTDLKIQ